MNKFLGVIAAVVTAFDDAVAVTGIEPVRLFVGKF
jgi:hypothetical protein